MNAMHRLILAITVPILIAAAAFAYDGAGWDTGGGGGGESQTFAQTKDFTANGALSDPAVHVNGSTLITGGTGTTTFPKVLISDPNSTAPTTWSTSGTMLGINAPSAFGGNLLAAHTNGTLDISIDMTGMITFARAGTFANLLSSQTGAPLMLRSSTTANGGIWFAQGSDYADTGAGDSYFKFYPVAASANMNGTGAQVYVSILPNYDQTGAGAGVDLEIMRTETVVGSGAQKLIKAGTAAYQGLWSLSNRGHVNTVAAVAPTSNCTIAAGSSDYAGKLSSCPAATTAWVTFNTAYANAPAVTANGSTQATWVSSATTTGFSVTATANLNTDTINYTVVGVNE